ncbi:glycosyltransferase [bacterium]|nr:glycosyltransferase [bacterium]
MSPDRSNSEDRNPGTPIRLAMILPGLGTVRRGAETAFIEIARRLSALPDFQVTLIGMGSEGLDGLDHVVVSAPGRDRFRRWPGLPAFRNFMAWEEFFFALSMRLSGRFRPSRFDVAIGCSYPWIPWIVRRTSFRHAPAFVFVTQNGDWPVRAGNREYRFFGCEGLVCVSPEHESRCRGRFPTVIIGNGVDIDRFRPHRFSEDRSLPVGIEEHLPASESGTKIVLVCAALTQEKRVDAAIKAVSRSPGTFLLVVGDGPLKSDLVGLAGHLLPGRHHFAGSMPLELMPAIYRRADALLHMNVHEPFGIVYLEAAATALPIVAPDVPTARWILADAANYFPDPDGAEGVSECLMKALDPSRSSELGQLARARAVNEWTWDKQSMRYAEFLRAIHRQTATVHP